ncbi:WAT1-related protein At1g25270-like [Benincasa hispida]|uniref:WAT1-related protein At1g25270-like n=1 Tax=Benincasa hispida TaxID=102211 RepID=UPI001900D053|nr:WAT1-related protein At1g25270-like [Benincasa hispida]
MESGWRICNSLHAAKPAILMALVQSIYAGVNVLYKLAVNDGMNLMILIAFRFIFASIFMLPLAFFLERNKRPKMTWSILFYGFLCGLFGGTLSQNLYVQSLAMTSATFVSAMQNLSPAITFLLALSFRMEKLNIKKKEGMAKVAGTLVGIGGAMILTFYKGLEINIWTTHVDLLHGRHVAQNLHSQNFVMGSLLALASCLSYSFWLILQTKMTKIYPCQYSSTAVMCVMGAIQGIVISICVERDGKQWKLGWNIRLLTVAFAGIVGTGAVVTVMAWCVRMRGPLYVSIFSPLMLLLVAIAGSLCLDEKLHLGSVVGAVLIVCGLYMVLWGKSKEMNKCLQLIPSQSLQQLDQLKDIAVVTTPKHQNETQIQDINNNNNKSIIIT